MAIGLDPFTAIANGIGSAFNFGSGLVLNSREKNAAAFVLQKSKIDAEFATDEFERNQKLLILQRQFQAEQARIDEVERADLAKTIAIVGLFATLLIVIVIAFKSRQ